ncbi:transcriptional regulator [Streptomyces mashuensis]|uniref:Transcriptional regulator n=1 Tax=Streptomyces mashuensis TaxID=33904 RepID=A0A919B250_9ACTN|nr:helix-turn-helix transcriptional regulator [Streptomyces mashuensis]GHF36720.1 transcriptional regulator [Streptomyces mashuensis]
MGQSALRTARRQRLGAELKALREAARVSAEEAAKAIHGDRTKISRQETGRHLISRLELEALLGLYNVTDDKTREWLIALASEGRKRSWWRQRSDALGPTFKELLTLESDAARICAYQAQVVPGLLQTREYATAVISSFDFTPADQVEFCVDLRMDRQDIFRRANPPQYLCLLPEGILRQQIGGPRAAARQLRRLVELSNPPDMTIQVIPFTQQTCPPTGGSFVVYSYPDHLDLDVVQVEYLDGALYLQEDATVEKYRKVLDGLRACALSAQQSAELISSIADELERT